MDRMKTSRFFYSYFYITISPFFYPRDIIIRGLSISDILLSFVNSFYIGNPVNHFPVYEPSAERIAEIMAAHAEENNPLGVHYDASQEVRAKGAGFYQFSGDEETRKAQMEELKSAREETGKIRQETGAVDVHPGKVEGMREAGGAVGAKSRAMEKRKREIEERRKLIDAKRRKITGDVGELSTSGPMPGPSTSESRPSPAAPVDPFAALEATATTWKSKTKPKTSPVQAPPANEADAFLAQLERDFTGSRKR